VLLTSSISRAQSAAATATPNARTHFQEGLASAQRGEVEAALRHFRTAYELQPHFSVLYNIGQAEATLGRPIQAVDSFERYLKDGGEQVKAERKASVLELISSNKRLIGQLRVVVAAPDRTRVWLDGTELTREQLTKPLPLKVGQHTLLHSHGSSFPVTQTVTVSSLGLAEIRIDPPADSVNGPGQLRVSCDVPGVTVDIQGGPRLMTPISEPVLVEAGLVGLRFSRPGYEVVERSVQVTPQRLSKVDCNQRALSRLGPELASKLKVRALPNDATTFVDGKPFLGAPLPSGPHTLRVERDGYAPYSTLLNLRPGKTLVQEAVLTPTPSHATLIQSRAEQRRLGYVLAGSSAALLLVSGGFYLWNNQRYQKFQDSMGGNTAQNLELATSIQRVDDLSVGLLITGVISGGAGGWLVWNNRD
jgi:hypothetical protein